MMKQYGVLATVGPAFLTQLFSMLGMWKGINKTVWMYLVFFGNGLLQILYVILAGYAYDTLLIDSRTNNDAAATYAVQQMKIEFLNFFAFTAFFDITLTMYFTAWYQAQMGTLDQLAEN